MGASLPVMELADVVVARLAIQALDADPPEEDVARRLHEALPDNDPPSVVVVLALTDEPLEHRSLGLLGLEEQWILFVSPDEEVDPGAGADAADADNLACGVDVFELLHRMVVIGE